MSTICLIVATLHAVHGIGAGTLPAERWTSIVTSNNAHPPSIDAPSVYDLPVIKLRLRNNSMPLIVADRAASGRSEYELIPPHTLHNHLHFLSLLNLGNTGKPEQANEQQADRDRLNPLISSTTNRYPKIEAPSTRQENTLHHGPKGGNSNESAAGSQMDGGRPIPKNNVLPYYADSYNMINYYYPEQNELNAIKIPQPPGGQYPLYVDEPTLSTTEASKLPAISDPSLLTFSALDDFISSIPNVYPVSLNRTDTSPSPSPAADSHSLALPALNQFISSIPQAFPALQESGPIPDVSLNPFKPNYMIQLASAGQMAPGAADVRNFTGSTSNPMTNPMANPIPITKPTTRPVTVTAIGTRANTTTTAAVSVPAVGAPATPVVGLSTPLLSALATIIADFASAISAFVTSLANSGTFTTALNGLLDFIISITLTPLCTASVSTQRAVVLLLSIVTALAIIKLKKCEKKSCYYPSYYRSLNEIAVSTDAVEEKIARVMKMIESLSKSTDQYR